MSKFNLEFKESVKTGSNRLSSIIDNPYKNFAASKMSNGRKTMCIVEYTDFMGKKHRIVCNNRKQMSEAQAFLSIFKQETATLKSIVSQYPIKLGRIEKKFLKELRSELNPLGFSNKLINEIAGW
jgi:hypothetical protein